MKSRFALLILSTFLVCAATGNLLGQIDCETPECFTGTLSLNTGVDHAVDTLYGVPANQNGNAILRDPYWRTVQSPTLNINLGNPWVIPHLPVAWDNGNPTTIARWLSPLRNSRYRVNNPDPRPAFIFERCFCTCEPGPLDFDFRVFGDDAIVKVELGPHALYDDPTNGGPNFGRGQYIRNTGTRMFSAGKHCLRVHLRNLNGARMGFKVEGEISGPHLVNDNCCDPRGEIAGFKFHDVNVNGNWDSGEPALSGWRIDLNNGQWVLTDAVGFYSFNNLMPGNYTVTETQQSGWWQTMPPNNQPHNVALSGFQSLTRNFGNADEGPIQGADIVGKKFHDLNCNGVRDANEPFLAGWTFLLYDANGDLVQPAVSDRDGCFTFSNLPNGSYTVQEVPQTGWQQSWPANGTSYHVLVEEPISYTIQFGNCLVEDPDACCDLDTIAAVFHEDFESPAVNNTTDYTLGTGQLPGEYVYLNASQASTISGGVWDARGYSSSNCDPNDRFMVVNGRTGGTGEREIYRSDILNTQNDEEYTICVQFKHLPQCLFDVVPTVRIEVVSVFGSPSAPLFASPNTQVVTGPGNCDYLTISGTFMGVTPIGVQGAIIRIFLDETGIGAGNDLVVDEIRVQEIPVVPSALRTFSVTKTQPNNVGDYELSVTAPTLPPDCTGRWEIFRIIDSNPPLTPIPGTYMTGNAATGWGNATNFTGYNSIPPAAGVFNNRFLYAIRRIVDCDCYEEGATRTIINSEINGFRIINEGPEETLQAITIEEPEPLNLTITNQPSEANGIRIVPNPLQTNCQLVFRTPPTKDGKLHIFNLQGQEVQTISYQAGTSSVEINLSSVPPATYIVGGMVDGERVQEKIIKQ